MRDEAEFAQMSQPPPPANAPKCLQEPYSRAQMAQDPTPTPRALQVALGGIVLGVALVLSAGLSALLDATAMTSGALAIAGGVCLLVVPALAGLHRN